MRQTEKSVRQSNQKPYSWRKKKGKWTDTLFNKNLLSNPSLMTSSELAQALIEHQEWRIGIGKYLWNEDPIKEKAENEMPFSPKVLTKLLWETISRLQIGGDLALGRLKANAR